LHFVIVAGACGDNLDTMRIEAVALKRGPGLKAPEGVQIMGTVTCDACGEGFWIGHYSASGDPTVASSQAAWLEKILAHDHERERKHRDKINLP
jgi:hypothetical protein